MDAISERAALQYIAYTKCLDLNDMDDTSWKSRCDPKQGLLLLSHENRDSRREYMGNWQWDLGPNKTGSSKKSPVKLGYPVEIDHQVCSNIHKTGTRYSLSC
jgi:hypothetical protein